LITFVIAASSLWQGISTAIDGELISGRLSTSFSLPDALQQSLNFAVTDDHPRPSTSGQLWQQTQHCDTRIRASAWRG
jgi:hypothetical protein